VLNDTLLVENLNETSVGAIPTNLTNGSYEISPPTFSYEPAQPSAGEITTFKVDGAEAQSALTYSWNFGDGTATVNTTQPTIAHAFPAGEYSVTLTCYLNGAESTTVETVNVGYYMPLDVTAEVGSLHFKGETAEFTVLTTDSGIPVNATSLEAELYFNGTLISDLSSAVQTVDTGLYNVPYYIPADAPAGEYTMLIKAEYYGANGAAIAKFTISPTLSAWNDSMARITGIQNGVATITNGVTTLTLNLASVNATLSGLIQTNGQTLATISTSLGTLTTSLNTIDAKIGASNGNDVTVYSDLGDITTKLNGVQSTATTTLYLASALSAIAVILALAILMLMFMRKK
jgi:aerobic-type carbon monoxide dehydrogenase small subunit (CoxS/CutS family)